jgi:hypothetical protein
MCTAVRYTHISSVSTKFSMVIVGLISRTSYILIQAGNFVPLYQMNGLRVPQRTIWSVLLILPVAGLVLAYTFGGERRGAIWSALSRPQRPSTSMEQSPDHQDEDTLTTIISHDLARELRAIALRIEISELRARQEIKRRQEIINQQPQELATSTFDRFRTESLPLEDLSSAHGSQAGEIPAPPYELSDGGRRRYD